MSDGPTGLQAIFAAWRERVTQRRRAFDRRFERWHPHYPIALALLPLGFLLVIAAIDKAFGVHWASAEIALFEGRAPTLETRPIVEFVIGLSLIAISVGIALRSRLAWLWAVGATASGLFLRLPPETVDLHLVIYFAAMLALLLLYRRSFESRGVVTSVAFALVALVCFFCWATLGTLRLGHEFEPPVRDLPTALYVTVVTVASVGYGDFVPRGPEARLFVVVMISLGIVVAATALSAILLPLIGGRVREILGGKRTVDRSNHYVIVGKSPLARNATTELEQRGQRVTLILDRAPEEDFYKQRDVVVGDAADLSVLRAAGTEQAKGVLTLSTDDATNGFVVLGVNELDASIPTVAALNDPAFRYRLKRTQPSMILSLQALGGELLAMALTGERVEVEMLGRVLQVHGTEPEAES